MVTAVAKHVCSQRGPSRAFMRDICSHCVFAWRVPTYHMSVDMHTEIPCMDKRSRPTHMYTHQHGRMLVQPRTCLVPCTLRTCAHSHRSIALTCVQSDRACSQEGYTCALRSIHCVVIHGQFPQACACSIGTSDTLCFVLSRHHWAFRCSHVRSQFCTIAVFAPQP